MKISLSVNLSDILTEKKSILENLFSWGSFFDNGFHPSRVFSLFEKGKFDGIELVSSKDIKMSDLEKLKIVLKEKGIPVLGVHQPILNLYDMTLEKINKLFEEAAFLSARIIVLHLFSLGKRIYERNFVEALKSLEIKHSIKIGIENGTKNIFLGLKPYCYKEKEFSETISKSGMAITFDTTHLGEAGGDIISFYRKNKERIINIHLSDYKSKIFKHNLFTTHLPLGKGALPIEELLKILKEDNYSGSLVLEINRGTKDILESADFVRKFIN